MSIDVPLAHCPASTVKVYVDNPGVKTSITEGVHNPVTPSKEVVNKAPGGSCKQYGPRASNVLATSGVIVMSIVIILAHSPASGVNVYVLVPETDVLIVDGLQVPEIPLVDITSNDGAVILIHKGSI
jgi:hypothetical protein